MRKFVFLFIVLALALSACSGAVTRTASIPVTGTEVAAPAAAGETPAESAVATTAAPAEPAITATEAPVVQESAAPQAGAALSGVVDYALAPEESTLTYEVGETFLQENNRLNLAVGTTQGVTGDIQVNFDQPQATSLGTMTADISGFQSDSGRRDRAIQDRFLQTAQFPTVTFTPTQIEGLPEKIEPGVGYPLTLQGDLTIRDTTRPASFDTKVTLQDDALSGLAVTTILMSDFGFGPIDILGMLKTEDQVKVTFDFVARPK
jgi:polyisoprenoid-binding protein YceI